MAASNLFVKFFLYLLFIAAAESRYLKWKNVPITADGISLRIVIKEGVKSGVPVATVKIDMKELGKSKADKNFAPTEEIVSTPKSITPKVFEEDKEVTAESTLPALDPLITGFEDPMPYLGTIKGHITPKDASLDLIPNFEDRAAIGDSKCPTGRKRMGIVCVPIGSI